MRLVSLLLCPLFLAPQAAQAGPCLNWSSPEALKAEIEAGREAYFLVDSPGALDILKAAEESLPCVAGQIPTETLSALYMSLGAVLLDLGEPEKADHALRLGAWAGANAPWDPALEMRAKEIYLKHLDDRAQAPLAPVVSQEGMMSIDGDMLAPGEERAFPVGPHYLQQELEAGLWIGGWMDLAPEDAPCAPSLGAMPGQWICTPIEAPDAAPADLAPLAPAVGVSTQAFKRKSALYGGATLTALVAWSTLNYRFYISETIQRSDPNYTRTALAYYGISAGLIAGGIGTTVNLRRLRRGTTPPGDLSLLIHPGSLALQWSW